MMKKLADILHSPEGTAVNAHQPISKKVEQKLLLIFAGDSEPDKIKIDGIDYILCWGTNQKFNDRIYKALEVYASEENSSSETPQAAPHDVERVVADLIIKEYQNDHNKNKVRFIADSAYEFLKSYGLPRVILEFMVSSDKFREEREIISGIIKGYNNVSK